MKRVQRLGLGLGLLIAGALFAWRLYQGPSPETILARIETPPSPVLSPEEELATFRLAPGFKAELVAAEPLVIDPVAMDWDDEGRLFVVEMRGYMPNIEGQGEDAPVGRVVVLEDTNQDGQMDHSRVFLDELVLPRAIAVLPEGVLIGEPPHLWLCRDANRDLVCGPEEKTRWGDYGADPGNVEHLENGLLPALDGWLYNSKSDRRFWIDADENPPLRVQQTAFRGQWGLAQDDEGLLYYNHNSGFLYADLFPAEYLLRQPATAAALAPPGRGIDLAKGESVFGVRVAPGLNRAYQPGTLRRDGRQDAPTGISGLTIQRGHQFGEDYVGDAFVPESAGSAVAHIEIDRSGVDWQGKHRLYPDPDYDEREFLASTDERFRPVDARVGPDGAVWVIDMYRGVIQHAFYISDYLHDYIEAHELAPPGATGRIWRLVREDQPIERGVPPLLSTADQLHALDHPNGWVRDRAQRNLIHSVDPRAREGLQAIDQHSAHGQSHALFALATRGELDLATWQRALQSSYDRVRRAALRAGDHLATAHGASMLGPLLSELEASHPRNRLQAIHSLGSLQPELRPLERLLSEARAAQPIVRFSTLSSLAGLEDSAYQREVEVAQSVSPSRRSETHLPWLTELTTAAFFAAVQGEANDPSLASFLDDAAQIAEKDPELAEALLSGIEAAQQLPGFQRVMLATAHPVFDTPSGSEVFDVLLRVRSGFTWPGDTRPGGARALTPLEESRRKKGEALFAASCATCHGPAGRGLDGLAPPLVASKWVRDADDWLIRIALHGATGPIHVGDATWNSTMPGHGRDPRFDDESLAGLLTFVRRAWGHGDEPVSPETVKRIRQETQDRSEPWTATELEALEITHRLDPLTGRYRIPIVGIELFVVRQGDELAIGRSSDSVGALTEIGTGLFTGQGMQLRFDLGDEGRPESAQVRFGSDTITAKRVSS